VKVLNFIHSTTKMMINMKKFIAFITAILAIGTAFSQKDSSATSAFKLSGSADVYYRYNFDNPKNFTNNLTSFTNSQNSFELGMASIKAEHTIGKVGMTADLGFGQRADEFSYTDAQGTSVSRFAIKQLFVTYAPSDKIKFTFGEWATHIGYELVDAYLNRNYSMSYMFSYGPFLHTGIKADISLGGKNAFMVGLSNPTDFKSASHMPKTIIAQFSTGSKDDKLKAYFNFQGGKQTDSAKLYQGDVVLTYAVSDKFSFGYNGTLQSRRFKSEGKWDDANSWWGSALYVNVDPVSWFGLTLRGEYIGDKKTVLGIFGNEGNGFETTLSGNFRIENLTIIPEFRLDNAKNEVFIKNDGSSAKSTGSFILAATYHF
jgi:hypothetical protein